MIDAEIVEIPEGSSVALVSNRIIRAMPPPDRAALLGMLEQVHLSHGQSLAPPSGKPQYVYFPEGAVVALVPPPSDGLSVGICLIGNDGMVGIEGLMGGNYSVYQPVVDVPGHSLMAPLSGVERLLERSPAFKRVVRQYTWNLLAAVSRLGVCSGRHSLEQRLCLWLLMMRDRIHTDDIPLTHEAISRRLGLRRAGITVATGKLSRQQIVQHGRGRIRIVDREALEASACSCYRVMRDLEEAPLRKG